MPRKKFLRYALRALTALILLIFGTQIPAMWPITYASVTSYLTVYAETLSALALTAQAIIILASLIYARGLYFETKTTAARNNTLAHIFEEHTDTTVGKQRTLFRSVRDDDHDKLEHYYSLSAHEERVRARWEAPAKPKKHAGSEEDWRTEAWEQFWEVEQDRWRQTKAAILSVLNRYETFALGIATDAIDEKMYKRWWRATLVHDWRASQPLVEGMQAVAPNAYIEFQTLAEKWHDEIRREKRAARQAIQEE